MMTDEQRARQRFIVLAALRFGGVALAFTGISIVMKRWIEPADIIGTLLIAVGAFDVIVLPVLLARKWRTPDQP
jgi:hypothetical protein